jgi:cyclopropane-fatty-acyl-phospholipid synthase
MLVGPIQAGSGLPFSSHVTERPSRAIDRRVLAAVQRTVAQAPIRFELWDGFSVAPPGELPVATVVLKNRRALYSWLWDPELNFGETYMQGAMEVRGDLRSLLRAIYRAFPDSTRRSLTARELHDERTSRDNVHNHYDLGNEFYRLWLDESMSYTCAYFPARETPLEAAQIAKMDRVCQKIWLKPGDRVIEAGCGWGSLALHMARKYGARVLACNISHEQIAYARTRAKEEGLSDRVDFIEEDYRNLTGRCDAFVSVGMLEHVGLEQYEALGALIHRLLDSTGRGLLHFIGRDRPEPLNAWIRKRIFPGAYPPSLQEVCARIFEPARLSVLDVENLRHHYAATLEYWFQSFERHVSDVEHLFDSAFVRAWRLYLAGSQVAFQTGSLQLFQTVFTQRGSSAIPWTRGS